MKWIIQNSGEVEEKFYMEDISTISFGFYKFEFLKLSERQNNIICKLINDMEDKEAWEIGNFAVDLRLSQIPYRLKYSWQENLSKDKNMELYAKEFLPFYKELLEKNILIEI